MSQKEHSRAHRSRTYKRVRGVILILLVLGIIWGITALVRHNAAQPDPTPDPNAGQQTGTTDEKQNNQTPDPDPDPEPSPDPAPEPTPDPTPDPKPTPDPEPSGTNLTNPGSDDWRTILVSAKYPLAEELDMEREFICNYAGFDLKVDARIAQPLRDFMAAAKADGYDLQLISAYRTFARSAILLENEVQAQMKYNGYSREKAEQVAATRVAPPGTSEHNTGLAVDILSDTPGMNAAATVLLAFLRPSLLRLFMPRDNPDSLIPSFKTMGISPFLKYTTASVFVHSLALLSIEFFSFTSIWLLLLRVLLCTVLTVTCIIAIEGIKK